MLPLPLEFLAKCACEPDLAAQLPAPGCASCLLATLLGRRSCDWSLQAEASTALRALACVRSVSSRVRSRHVHAAPTGCEPQAASQRQRGPFVEAEPGPHTPSCVCCAARGCAAYVAGQQPPASQPAPLPLLSQSCCRTPHLCSHVSRRPWARSAQVASPLGTRCCLCMLRRGPMRPASPSCLGTTCCCCC